MGSNKQTFNATLIALSMLAFVQMNTHAASANDEKKDPHQPHFHGLAKKIQTDGKIVPTQFPVWAVIRELLPSTLISEPLLRPGLSPHTHDLKPSNAKVMTEGLAIVGVSQQIDAWAKGEDRIDWMDGLPHSFQIFLIKDTPDPHFWLDPLAVKSTLPFLVEKFCHLIAHHCDQIKKNQIVFEKQLDKINKNLRAQFKQIKKTSVALTHPFFIYFLKRYEIEVAFIVHDRPSGYLGPKRIQKLIELTHKSQPRLLLTPRQNPSAHTAAQALIDATQMKLLELDPIGASSTITSYESLIRWNAQKLIQELSQ